MASIQKLQSELEFILGTEEVYFQPPESIKMSYPCIEYEFDGYHTVRANNHLYLTMPRYSLTVIDKNPESDIHFKIMNHFQYCSFDREYKADNLYHQVLSLYFAET